MKTARATAILFLIFIFTAVMPCMAMANTIGKFTAIEGDVDVLMSGMERAAPAALQQPVSEGDIVRTKSNAKAEITFADDSVIRLAPGTRLQITEYLMEGSKRKSGVMNLFRGKVRAVVSKSRGFLGVTFGAGDRFEVRTPTAVAGVKGTDFFVSYSMGVTNIVVTDGRVDVFNPAVPGQIVRVTTGNATFIAGDKPPSAPRPAADVEAIQHTKDTDTSNTGGKDTGGAGAVLPITETNTELLPPVITLATSPPSITNSSTAAFTITFNRPVSVTYTMGNWGTTTTNTTSDTFSIAGLPEGTYILTITATDATGNTSTTTYTWTTDYTPPVITGVSGPASLTNSSSAAFGFTANEAASSYSYSLDGGVTWVSTGSSLNLSGIPEGANTIEVRATDLAGNTSVVAGYGSYSWFYGSQAYTLSDPNSNFASLSNIGLVWDGSIDGLMYGTSLLWNGSSSFAATGTYDNPNNRSLWSTGLSGTTTDGGTLLGGMSGIGVNDVIEGLSNGFYIRTDGTAGYFYSNDISGNFYPDINTFYLSGAITTVDMGTTYVDPSQLYTGSPDLNLTSYLGKTTGDITGFNKVISVSISDQDWGIWVGESGGRYSTTPAINWTSYMKLDSSNGYWIGNITGTDWSNGKLTGNILGAGADISATPYTWITVGETIGTFDAVSYTWQALQTGAWVETSKFLSMTQTSAGQASLTALNIPFVEVGRATLSGSGNKFTNITMTDTIFFAYQTGAAPTIWATGNVSGTYFATPALNTAVSLTGSGLSANFNVQQWNTTSGNWMATVTNGNIPVNTMNNTSSLTFSGAAAGTGATSSSGTITGTAAGVVK